ncbi:MAG: PorV/PorQ family protein [Ignavibacteriae bacterium]|nr:PorV/PorQ family protein [Ignavibacteriota bacterium]
MNVHRSVLVVLALALPLQGFAQIGSRNVAKTGTVGAAFLEIPAGAAAVGMGTAFVSHASDASALYWNPAGAARFEKNQVLANHMSWIAETRFDFAALILPLGEAGTVGVSFLSLGMEDMKVRTVDMPEGTGEYFSANDLAVGLSYARKLSDRFAVGASVKYIQQSIWHETASAFALDIGTLFRTDLLGGMVIGASLSNFGTSLTLDGRDTRQFGRVDETILGSNDRIPSTIEMDSWELPLLFQIGVSFDPVAVDAYRWTVAVDALHPNDNDESMNIGTELAYSEALFLRAGYHSLFLPESEGGLSLGFGVTSALLFSSTTDVQLDYAYRDMGRLGGVNMISFGVRF